MGEQSKAFGEPAERMAGMMVRAVGDQPWEELRLEANYVDRGVYDFSFKVKNNDKEHEISLPGEICMFVSHWHFDLEKSERELWQSFTLLVGRNGQFDMDLKYGS